MTAQFDADRRIGAWIVAEAPATAPDRILEVVMERVDVTRQRRPLRERVARTWRALSPARRLVVVAFALLALAASVVLVGAIVSRLTPGSPTALLIATPPFGGPEQITELTLIAIDPDGDRRTIASVPAAPADANFNGTPIAVSRDGFLAVPIYFGIDGSQAVSVLDLRNPGATAAIVDVHAWGVGRWLPDGRLVVITEANGLAIYDPSTGRTQTLSLGGATPWSVGGRVLWAGDDHGFLATQDTPSGRALGVITLEGTFEPGATPALDDGLGPRRTRPDGARLVCHLDRDDACEPGATLYAVGDGAAEPIWTDPDSNRRIDDYSWASDGRGLWVLTDAVGDATDVRLLSVTPSGEAREVARLTLTGEGLTYEPTVPVAEFAAMSPDDARIVISAPRFGWGNLIQDWAVEPRDGTATKLDGSLVGWLGPSSLTSPRPSIATVTETDPTIRGTWAASLAQPVVTGDGTALEAGSVPVEIGRTSITVGLGDGVYWPLQATATSSDTLELAGTTQALGCPPGAVATYRWSIPDGQVALDPVSEPCQARAALFARPLEHVLPPSGTSARTAFEGVTYAAPSFVWPFHVTIPSSGQADVPWSDERIVFMQGMTASETNLITIEHARAGLVDPCDPTGATVPIAPGLDGFRAYIEGLADRGLTIGPFEETEVGGRRALATDVEFGTVCPGETQSLFDQTSENGWSPMGAHVRVWLLAGDDGTHVAITEGPVVSLSPWMEELLATLRFDRAP